MSLVTIVNTSFLKSYAKNIATGKMFYWRKSLNLILAKYLK